MTRSKTLIVLNLILQNEGCWFIVPYCELLLENTGLAQILHKEEIVRSMDWAGSKEACSHTKPLLYTPSSCKAGAFFHVVLLWFYALTPIALEMIKTGQERNGQ